MAQLPVVRKRADLAEQPIQIGHDQQQGSGEKYEPCLTYFGVFELEHG